MILGCRLEPVPNGHESEQFTLDDESRHPLSEPAQWVLAYSNRQCRMRGLFDRPFDFTQGGELCRTSGGFHCEAEGREGEGRGRPIRELRLMATTYRPRPEDLRPEASLSEESKNPKSSTVLPSS